MAFLTAADHKLSLQILFLNAVKSKETLPCLPGDRDQRQTIQNLPGELRGKKNHPVHLQRTCPSYEVVSWDLSLWFELWVLFGLGFFIFVCFGLGFFSLQDANSVYKRHCKTGGSKKHKAQHQPFGLERTLQIISFYPSTSPQGFQQSAEISNRAPKPLMKTRQDFQRQSNTQICISLGDLHFPEPTAEFSSPDKVTAKPKPSSWDSSSLPRQQQSCSLRMGMATPWEHRGFTSKLPNSSLIAEHRHETQKVLTKARLWLAFCPGATLSCSLGRSV